MADVKKAMDAFQKKGFDVSFFETKEDAATYLKETIRNTTVAFGGSVTLSEMGLYELLSEENIVSSHSRVRSPEVFALSRQCKIYISSVNALSETGEIVNIDGVGNRLASTIFGHEKVYLITGVNKLTKDVESAIYRARNVAAPKNAKRLNMKTPCAVNADRCYDCDSPDRICRGVCILERNLRGAHCEIVFINESLGY